MSSDSKEEQPEGGIALLYRYRWFLSFIAMAASVLLFAQGIGAIGDFSSRVNSLSEIEVENPQPKMFDTRTDIWFDPQDEGLLAYRDVEDQFIAEDIVIVAFEEKKDPWGVFGSDSLALIQELTHEFEKVPYVRNVRSLTSSPWIRDGEVAPGEQGLIVTDLFDNDVKTFGQDARLERMIAVLGAEKASAIAGKEEVRKILGPDARFKDHTGEPRFIDSIVSADGKSAAIQVQVIRQRPDDAALTAAFPNPDAGDQEVAQALHTIDAQGLEPILKTLGHLEQDHRRSELEKCEVVVSFRFPANDKRAESVVPGVGSFDDPTTRPRSALAGLLFLAS